VAVPFGQARAVAVVWLRVSDRIRICAVGSKALLGMMWDDLGGGGAIH
jgi:hypothetical protein